MISSSNSTPNVTAAVLARSGEEVLRLAEVLRRDEVEVRRYLKRFLHGKAYMFRGGVYRRLGQLHLRRSRA